MDINTTLKTINSIGLLFDLLGAWFVAVEVVRKYKGEKYEKPDGTWDSLKRPPQETTEYSRWEFRKHKYMAIGLALLTLGFLLQILSNWPCMISSIVSMVSFKMK